MSGKCQKMQQVSEENSNGSLWSKTKKMFFEQNDEKEVVRGKQMYAKFPSYCGSQAYLPESVEKKEKLCFEQLDNTLLSCEFCQHEFPASELVLHETACQPQLVSFAKPDLPEKSDSKKGSVQKDSSAFKSQNIHSAGGISHPFFAKNDSVLTRHDASERTEHNRKSKTVELPQNDQSSETCPTCKNTFSKWKIAEHRNKCSQLKETCTFCNLMIVSCRDIHLLYCPGIDNRDSKTRVAQNLGSSNDKCTTLNDVMKPRSAMCFYCHTSYNVDILPNHEKECIHMPILCDFCDTQILLKDVNAHNCKRKKENVSCSIQTDVPVIDVENPKDEDLSFLDAKDVTLLTEGMKKLLIKGSDHDVKIVVKDKEFRAHRNILCARSPVFAMILSHDTDESNTGTITVSDCDPDSFDELLLYVYTGKMENLTPSKAFHLYYTADKYDFPALKERCVILLKTSLSVESVCDVVFLAAKHGEKELLEAATEFFALNMREILVTVRWQEFLSENPVEGNELYIKSMDILVPRK